MWPGLVALRSVYDLTGIMAVVLLLSAMAVALDQVLLILRPVILQWSDATNPSRGGA